MKYKVALTKNWAMNEKRSVKEILKKLDYISFEQCECGRNTPLELTDKQVRVLYWALDSYYKKISIVEYKGEALTQREINNNAKLVEWLSSDSNELYIYSGYNENEPDD